VKRAADSSIAIAALWGDHPANEPAAEALATCESVIAHVAVETYSVLTRLPVPHRASEAAAVAAVEERLAGTYATLEGSMYPAALRRLAGAGVSGGATYDGLIALTALEHGLELITRERRAERTYRALAAPYTLL
jgi:predicted nucleic acid-binding protein